MASKKKNRVKAKNNRSKARAQFKHAAKRLSERFDIIIGPQLYGHFVEEIQTGKAEFMRKQSNRVTLWRTQHEGQSIVLVYDKQRKTIVTALHDTELKGSIYADAVN